MTGAARPCSVCGTHPTQSQFGICTRTPDCKRAYDRANVEAQKLAENFSPVDEDNPLAVAFRARLMELHGVGGEASTASKMLKRMGDHAAYGGAKGCAACDRARIGHLPRGLLL